MLISEDYAQNRLHVNSGRKEHRVHGGIVWLTRTLRDSDWHKPHIEQAPYIIVVFAQIYGLVTEPDGTQRKIKHYYVQESVGIVVCFLLASLTHAGLATLTHTPNPMGFLSKLLQRPPNERAYVLIAMGILP